MKQAKKNKEYRLFLIRSRWTYPIYQRTINWVYKQKYFIVPPHNSFEEFDSWVSSIQLDNNK